MANEADKSSDALSMLKVRFLALPPRLRVLLGVGAVAVMGVAAVWNGADQLGADSYLFTGLEASDAGDIVGKLKEQRVPYTLEAGGTAIMVPGTKVHELRLSLAQAGLPRGGGVGFEIFDKPTYGQSDFVQQKNYLRALQGELERTIASISSVQKARVHLVLPEKRLFREAGEGAQASVVVKVRPGRVISEAQAAGMVHLVASSVPGLAPERVTLVDDMGRMLSSPSQGQGLSSEDLDYKRKLEHGLEDKVRSILDSALGARQSSVQVSAELDFTKVERVEESYDPDKRVVRSEQSSNDKQTQHNPGAGGVPGVQTNLPGVTVLTQASSQPVVGSESERHNETRNYEVSKVTSRTVMAPARLQRINAAVLVDGKLPDAEVEMLASIVKQALGMDDKRGDQLAIRSVAFHTNAEEKGEDANKWLALLRDHSKQLALVLIGLAGALALVMVAFQGRKARHHAPVAMLSAGPRSVREMEAMMAGGREQQAAIAGDQLSLKSAVQNDNQKAVGVLRGWLTEAK
jgi:flagellar M-ring protein FliF